MVSKSSENNKPKAKHKKGLWSPEEDLKLRNYVLKHGHGCWSSVPINAGYFPFPFSYSLLYFWVFFYLLIYWCLYESATGNVM